MLCNHFREPPVRLLYLPSAQHLVERLKEGYSPSYSSRSWRILIENNFKSRHGSLLATDLESVESRLTS